MYRFRGIGDTASTFGVSTNPAYDCSNAFLWALNAKCWAYSPAAWSQMRQFAPPPAPTAPPPAPPEAYGTVPAPFDCAADPTSSPSCPGYDAAVAAAIAARDAENKARAQQAMSEQPNVAPDCDGAYLDDTGNWRCPYKFSMPLWGWALIGVGGLWAVASIMGGRR